MEVTIGTRIDSIINAGIVAIGDTAAWLLNRLSPFDEVEAQRFLTMGAADALADMEAENESWLPDELWAATLHHNTTRCSGVFSCPRTAFSTTQGERKHNHGEKNDDH